jgi:hypothetical protein
MATDEGAMVGVAALGVNIVFTIVTLAGLAGGGFIGRRGAARSFMVRGAASSAPSCGRGRPPVPARDHQRAGPDPKGRKRRGAERCPRGRTMPARGPRRFYIVLQRVQRTRHTMNKITHTVASIDSLEGRRQNRAQKSPGSRQNLPRGPHRSRVVSWTATMKKSSPRVLPAQASMLLTEQYVESE